MKLSEELKEEILQKYTKVFSALGRLENHPSSSSRQSERIIG